MPGGNVNITCVAVGSPMPYVKWMMGAEDLTPEDDMPVGRNVLELTNVKESANYTCVAMSSLGVIESVAQITVKSLPKAPGTPVVTETTATSITITWDSGNPDPISYYIIEYKSKTQDGPYQIKEDITTTRYSIGGLSPNSEYEIWVSAVNSIGQGPPSESVVTRTGEQAPASAPRNVQARMLSSTTMIIQWEEPVEPNGQIRGYRVYYTMEPEQPVSNWLKYNVEDNLLTTIANLLEHETYTVRVLAFTSVGDGPLSDPIQVKTQQGVPGQPMNFRAEAKSETSISLTWSPPRQDSIVKYEVCYKEGDRGNEIRKTFDPATSYLVEGLKPNTEYIFRLSARSNQGQGAWTSDVRERTMQSKPSAPPQDVKCVSTRSTTILVSWQPPPAESHNGILAGYSVHYGALDSEDPVPKEVKDIPPQTTEILLEALEKWTEYRITVVAHTAVGPGPESSPVVVRTDEDVPSAPPRKVEVEVLNSTAIKVFWRSPVQNRQHGQIRGYQIHYVKMENGEAKGLPHIRDVMLADAQWEKDDTAEYEMIIDGLQPETTYSITVAAYTMKGDGARCKPKVVTTQNAVSGKPDLSINQILESSLLLQWEPPILPKNFKVKMVTKTSVLLSWEFPENYNSATPYKIQYGMQTVDVDGRTTKKLITNLKPKTYYSFILTSRGNTMSGLQQTVAVRTAPNMLGMKPLMNWKTDSDGRITVTLPNVGTAEAVRSYYIVVVPLKKSRGQFLNPWGSPEEMDLEDLVHSIAKLHRRSLRHLRHVEFPKPYIAARFQSLPLEFTLGDQKIHDGFENKALEFGQRYVFFILAMLEGAEAKMFAASPYSEPIFIEDPDPQPIIDGEEGLIWVIGPVLAVVFIICIVIAILLYKNKPDSKRKNSEPRTKCLLNNAEIPPHHPTDPVEMRRINFQTPGMLNHPPIPIADLSEHTEHLKANDNLKLSQEYESIDPGQQFTWEHSNLEVNKPKNRYANVIAYDHSRVILMPVEGILGSDYINANYIDGYRKQNAYIATQGPLPDTFGDFWRMVWEQRSATIVMMTRLEEKSRVKCDQYWPGRGADTYGMIQVTLLDTIELATFCVRTFSLHKNGSSEKREVRQFQFTAWPDHGVPEYPTPFLAFLRRVKTCNPPDAGPIVVHCSAGVGRTGCFIVIDAMLERIKHEKTVDIYGHVTLMRSQRNYMVQTEDQYSFIHDALFEAVACGNTEVPARNLYTYIQKLAQIETGEHVTGMELEFKRLANSKAHTSRFISANLPCNKFKNRLVNIMPYETTRVCLQPIRGVEGSDYINASFIDGYRQQKAYIATQGPLAETTEDFWRMLWENNSTIVVMLTKLREMGREKCHQYWPAERSARYQYFVVDPMAEYNMPQYILREFKVTDARDGQSRTVRQFQFTDWPEQGVPKSGEGFIDFIGQVHKTKEQFGQDGPISVHCSAGVGRTGVFITLSIVLERMRYEGVVDVFQTVKMLRTQRPAMVQTEDEYQFCYQASLEYLGSFDHYAT
ncbi:hypothetical protein GDO81_001129 [Engystomops pustulosus]|nr:hypothetical protein GDO81_001129 [Engystomops pustulosus]